MTFAEGMLRLVRGSLQPVEVALPRRLAHDDEPAAWPDEFGEMAAIEPAEFAEEIEPAEAPAHEPGFADIEAAVELVTAGLARRVVLTNFQSWPGLLWRAYQLAEEANVLILPTVVRPGGRVDIVVARERE